METLEPLLRRKFIEWLNSPDNNRAPGNTCLNACYALDEGKPWLKAIAVPTLVLNARNDPFIPASSLPVRAEAGPAITLEQPDHGGHAGFPEQRFPGGLDWLPQRLITYFNEVRGA